MREQRMRDMGRERLISLAFNLGERDGPEKKEKKRKEKWRDGMEAAAAPPWHQRLLKRSWKRGGGRIEMQGQKKEG